MYRDPAADTGNYATPQVRKLISLRRNVTTTPIRLSLQVRAAVTLALLIVFLVGCGQKGDLTLPNEPVARLSR